MRAVISSRIFFLTSLEEIKFARQTFCLWVFHPALQLRVQISPLHLLNPVSVPRGYCKGNIHKNEMEQHINKKCEFSIHYSWFPICAWKMSWTFTSILLYKYWPNRMFSRQHCSVWDCSQKEIQILFSKFCSSNVKYK